MAYVEQRAGGTYRARVRRQGAPDLSRSFDNRDDAIRWGEETEAAVRSGRLSEHRQKTVTLRELLEIYGARVTPSKKGSRQELVRITAMQRDPIAGFSLENLSRSVLRDFRDRRLKTITGSSINRELALISSVLKWAQAEHDAPVDLGVLAGLKQSENPARERRLQPGELERLQAAAPPWLKDYITLAVETCMRRGELAGVLWVDIDLRRRVITLQTSKNGSSRRVPLSGVALRTLESMARPIGGGKVFDIHVDNITSGFIDCCKKAGIKGLRLHDLRAEGVSRLFEKGLDMNSVKSISGHKSAIFMRYCRAGDVEALAQRLA